MDTEYGWLAVDRIEWHDVLDEGQQDEQRGLAEPGRLTDATSCCFTEVGLHKEKAYCVAHGQYCHVPEAFLNHMRLRGRASVTTSEGARRPLPTVSESYECDEDRPFDDIEDVDDFEDVDGEGSSCCLGQRRHVEHAVEDVDVEDVDREVEWRFFDQHHHVKHADEDVADEDVGVNDVDVEDVDREVDWRFMDQRYNFEDADVDVDEDVGVEDVGAEDVYRDIDWRFVDQRYHVDHANVDGDEDADGEGDAPPLDHVQHADAGPREHAMTGSPGPSYREFVGEFTNPACYPPGYQRPRRASPRPFRAFEVYRG